MKNVYNSKISIRLLMLMRVIASVFVLLFFMKTEIKAQTSYAFTNYDATSGTGQSPSQTNAVYTGGNSMYNNIASFGAIPLWTLPATVNYTSTASQTVIYSEYFTSGAYYSPGSVQYDHWVSFRAALNGGSFTSLTIKGSNDATGVSVTNPTIATQIAYALYTNSAGTWTSDGRVWKTGNCGGGIELSADGDMCQCSNGYILRPMIGNSNWGGVAGPTCGAANQQMTVIFSGGALPPAITTSASLSAFTACTGTASAAQGFSVSGAYLTDNIVVTAPAAYEVSTSLASGYAAGLTLIQSGGIVSNTTIYVRLSNTASASPSGNVSLTSANAVTRNVSVSGNVSIPSVGGTATGGTVVCYGSNSTTLTISGHTGSIQWQSSADNSIFNNINAQTSLNYTASNLISTTYYRATISSGVCPAVNSIATVITVNPTSVSGTITGATPVCTGTNSTLLTLNGYTGTIQWQSSANNSTFTNINTQTASTYTAENLSATTYYRAVVTSGVCSAKNATSVTMAVNPLSVAGSVAGSTVVCYGTNSTTLTLSGNTGSVQWQSSLDNTTFLPINGQTASTYTATNLTATTYFRAAVSSGVCAAVYTSPATITVNPTSIGGTVTGGSTVCSGINTTLLTLNGYTGNIKWQSSANNVTFADISGANASSYTAENLTATTYYRAVATSGVCASAYSVKDTIKVSPVSLAGIISGGNTTVCTGINSTVLSLSGYAGAIQWQSSTDNDTFNNINLATTSTYTATNLSATTYYRAVLTSGVCPLAITTATTITVSPYPEVAAISGLTTVCVASSINLNNTVSGGVWNSNANGIASVNSSGVVSGISAGGATISYAVSNTNNCTTTVFASVTVNATPAVAAITGTTSVCPGYTTTLSSSTTGGNWTSSENGIATVGASGIVSGLTAGNTTISYTITNGFNCSKTVSSSVTVNASIAAPNAVTASPANIETGGTSNLNATSTGNNIKWFTLASGGSFLGSSANGANYPVSPVSTTTYYAEANMTQSNYINTFSAANSYSLEHNTYSGDDRGGIAVTQSYYYYTGDANTLRFNMPGLTNPVSLTRNDGIFSELSGSGTLYTLWNGTSVPVYSSNTSPFNVTAVKTMNADLSLGSTTINLSAPISMISGNSAIYAGAGFVILQSNTSFYRVDLPSGTVTNMGSYSISKTGAESWSTWGIGELNSGVYSILYTSGNNILRLNLSTGAVTTHTSFSSLSDMACITYAPWYNRWYFHHEGTSQFRSGDETAGYADATFSSMNTGCPSLSRTPVTLNVINKPTITTTAVSDILDISASCEANISSDGGSAVIASGVCWSLSQNPTTSGTKSTDGTATGTFTSLITGLTPGTFYYVRAYASNSIGTSYGNQLSFTSYSPGTIAANQAICSGTTAALITSVSLAIGMPSVTYQWQSSTDSISFVDISGQTNTSYQPSALTELIYFRRNATSGAVTLHSNIITISINAGIEAASLVTATPASIQSGSSSNLNASTTTGNEIKWYNAASGGSLLTTVGSATNYSVSPTITTTYYAQASPVNCEENTLANILSNLNSNFANITSQIPSPYPFSDGITSNNISDGGSDMYDGGNYLSTNNSASFSYSDNSIIATSIFGTGGKYFTRKVNNLFVLAADMNNVSSFRVDGNYGSDGGGNTDAGTFSVTVGCQTFNCFVSRVYNAWDPSINELFIIPANPSASQTAIGNTNVSYHQLNGISASNRMYYLLYAGTTGGYINNASAQSIALAFLTQTQAVITGSGSCPSLTRTSVTLNVSNLPLITTTAVSSVTNNSAITGGNITNDGGSAITDKGVCWNTSHNPVITDTHFSNGIGIGSFTSSITGIVAGTTYYARAYATNALGYIAYGSEVIVTPFELGPFAAINKTYGDPDFSITNPTSASNGVFDYTSSDLNVATISGNTVHIIGAGTATITATQAAYTPYASAATSALLTVVKANQVLSLIIPTTAPLNTFIGTSLPITSSSSSGLAVNVSLGSASTATADLIYSSGNYNLSNVSSAGTIEILAVQPGDLNYNDAQLSQSFNVEKGNQSVTFNAIPPQTYSPLSIDLTSFASASSNLGVVFSVISGPGFLSGNTLNVTAAGVIVVEASQIGDSSWNPAPNVSQNITINKAIPVINFAAINKTYGDADFVLNATSNSTGAISFSSDDLNVATIAGNTVTIAGAGIATLTATQAMDDNYLATSIEALITVDKANQSITLTSLSDVLLSDFETNPIQLTATSNSGLAVSLSLGLGSVATINGSNQLISNGSTGSVTVNATQAGDDNYNAASTLQTFNVGKANQAITFTALADMYLGDPSFDLDATSSSNLLVSYSSSNPLVATISGKTVSIVGVGTTTITASQSGNTYYNSANSLDQDLNITYALPTISDFSPASVCEGSTVTINGSYLNGATLVSFGGTSVASYTVVSPTQITAIAGSGTSGDVSVFTAGGTVNMSGITVYPVSIGGTATATASTICNGSSTSIHLINQTGSIQWQQSADGINDWVDITNETSSTYITPDLSTASYYYRAKVSSGICTTDYSNIVTIQVDPGTVSGVAFADNSTICYATTAKINLTGNTGTIQWQESANGITGWADITNAHADSYITPALTTNNFYKAVVKSGVCLSQESSTVEIQISPLSLGGTATAAVTTICSGTAASINLTGNIGDIQWQQSDDGSSAWYDIAGITNNYTTTNLTAGTYYYRALISSGVCPSAISTVETITADPVSVGGNAIATASTICSGTSTIISLSGQTGGIQWQESLDGSSNWTNILNETSSVYTTQNLTSAKYYQAIVSSGVCASTSSIVAGVQIDPVSVAGLATAVSPVICAGNSASIQITGNTGSIQWQESEDGLTGWVDITGETSAVYVSQILSSATYYYRAIITSGVCSSVYSNVVEILVNPISILGGSISGNNHISYGSSSGILTLSGYTGTIQKWQKKLGNGSWQDISNITDEYSETPISSGNWYYRVVVVSGSCAEANSSEFSIVVDKIELTVLNAVVTQKIYDGNTIANISNAILSGVINSENVIFGNYSTANFNTANVGNGKTVISAMTISGAASSNYYLTQPILTGNITPKELTVINAIVTPKVYNGNDSAMITAASLFGKVGSDNVVLENHTSGKFSQSAIGNGLSVTTAPMTISGLAAGNYTLTQPILSGNIIVRELSVINASVTSKTYDGNDIATITNASLSGVVGSEDVILNDYSTGIFDNANVGNGKAVSTTMNISGSAINNYHFTKPVLTGNITAKMLMITADNKTKIYNGLVYSPFTVSYSGFVSGEDSTILNNVLTFTGSAVTAVDNGSYTIIPGGYQSNNYAVTFVNGTLLINCSPLVNVSNNLNIGYGSLRNAIANVCDNGSITFNSIDGQTIGLTTGTLTINKNLSFNNNNHTLGVAISGSGDNITINAGKTLTLASGSKITVVGGINNVSKGNSGLVIASGASFIHNTQNLAATVQRYLNTNWHIFASPFKKSLGAVLSNITPVGGSIQMKPYTNGVNWATPVTAPSYFLMPTVGYAVKPSINFTATLSGNLFYSPMIFDYTTSLVFNGTAASQSWNLVANPYTSYINWSLLGKTNVNATLYLWDNTLYPNSLPTANSSYLRTFNSCNNVGVPANTTPFISPSQGFFVKAVYTSPKLTYPPSARSHNSSTYYKEASNTEILLRLKAETASGTDELVVCRNQEAKLDFEKFDSEKLFNGLPLEIYSQSSTGEKLVINSINTTTNTIIPLGITGNTGDKGKITSFGLESAEQVFLEDRLKGKLISLSENTEYNFEFPTDNITGRFFIRFGNINTPLNSSDVKVFVNNNELNIIAQIGEELQKIEVYTVTGACVYKSDISNMNVFTAKLDVSSGVYLVRVKTSISTQNVKISWK